MRYEHSFGLNQLTSLKHPLTRLLLKRIKKLAVISFHRNASQMEPISSAQISYFGQCEEIELQNLEHENPLIFNLPKLRVLTIRENSVDKLVLNCPSLEVLFCNWKVGEMDLRDVKKLKRLICFGWPDKVSLNGKLENLVYLNMFTALDERVDAHLLRLMPNLKRFVIYTDNRPADLQIIRRQQKRYGLKNLEVLCAGFSGVPVDIGLSAGPSRALNGVLMMRRYTGDLFDNYSKLEENSMWRISIDYSTLFNKFKILPSNFFQRFSEYWDIEISAVTSHRHLFEFLRCCPFIERLKIHSFSKLKGDRILDLMHLQRQPLTGLTIVERRTADVLKINPSFIRLFDFANVTLESTHLPIEFLRKVEPYMSRNYSGLSFQPIGSDDQIIVLFLPKGAAGFLDTRFSPTPMTFPSLDYLIGWMRDEPLTRGFLV